MRKQLFAVTAVAAVFTLSAGMTAFASGWVEEKDQRGQVLGWAYQRENGTFVAETWFTDPETGYEYFFDPEGHIMKGTTVQGYYLDDNGIKQEKTEAQKAAEEARENRTSKNGSPGKDAQKAAAAGTAAADATTAVSTTRAAFQSEWETFSSKAFNTLKDNFSEADVSGYLNKIKKDNYETTYYLDTTSDDVRVLYSTISKASVETKANYTPYAVEFNYNRNIIHGDESSYVNDAFKTLVIAALGETEGAKVYDRIMQEPVGGDNRFTETGTTDTGNSYTLTYRYNNANIKVTCSEIVPETTEAAVESTEAASTEAAEAAATAETEASTEAATEAETEASTEAAAEAESEASTEAAAE